MIFFQNLLIFLELIFKLVINIIYITITTILEISKQLIFFVKRNSFLAPSLLS